VDAGSDGIASDVAAPACVEANTGVHAVYYPTMDFSGTPVVRTERGLLFDWGDGSPDPAIPSNEFTALLSARLTPEATDDYTLFVNADDGVRLWLDGTLLLDWWRVSPRPIATTVSLEGGRGYDLVIEYYDFVARALLDVSWKRPGTPRTAIPECALSPAPAALTGCPSAASAACVPAGTPPCTGTGRGLRATYYRWPGFTELVHTQTDAPVDYQPDWVAAPDRYTRKFTARWEGELEAPATDRYSFFLISDGQAELSIGGQKATTVLEDAASHEATASVELTAGQRYPIQIDYLDGHEAGWAYLQLRWKSGTIPKGAIPPCRFFSKAP
jgi:hypothetical protein